MSVTTPTLKFFGAALLVALEELVAPPPPAAALELDEELLEPHAVASANAAATTTNGVPRRQILDLITAPLSASAKGASLYHAADRCGGSSPVPSLDNLRLTRLAP
jgi:hypothetical protein